MKKLLLILNTAMLLLFAGCESWSGNDVLGGSYNINGAIQKGPFVQGSDITIQPLNSQLKPIGQMYTTQTINDAGMFEMDDINSKYAEIIATGYYFDEVEGKISDSPLTLRSIADLEDGTQTNVNLLTSLTYNRIKNLVTKEDKEIAEAQSQAEKELYTALGIPEDLQPSVSCSAMNIANSGDGDGLLLALSAVVQENRSVGELTQYISKFSVDLADDGFVSESILNKFNIDGQHLFLFEELVRSNLNKLYEELGQDSVMPEFEKYLPYLTDEATQYYTLSFTYDENELASVDLEDALVFESDATLFGWGTHNGKGEIVLISAPNCISKCSSPLFKTLTISEGVTSFGECAFNGYTNLESVSIPYSVQELCHNNIFRDCPKLKEFKGNFASEDGRCLVEIYSTLRAFAPAGVKEYTIPENVGTIGCGVFNQCRELESITIPDSVGFIEEDAFSGCERLWSITIGNGVKGIDVAAFCYLPIFTITIPDSVTWIGDKAFCGCWQLHTLTIGSGVTLIGESAFSFSAPGMEVYCKPTTPPAGNSFMFEFTHSTMPRIYVPSESVEAYKTAEYWCEYADNIEGYDFNE